LTLSKTARQEAEGFPGPMHGGIATLENTFYAARVEASIGIVRK